MTQHYVVVGAGLAGSATAWSLARRGHEVMLLEQTSPANERGSSHGSARILRHSYADVFYSRLVGEAREDWNRLESVAGTSLIRTTGALDFGDVRGPRQLADVLSQVGVDHELFTADEAGARWPHMNFDSDVLWHPSAGVIDAEASVLAMVEQARQMGATIHCNWRLSRVERSATGYLLVSDAGESVSTEHLVLAAGGWLPDVLSTLAITNSISGMLPALTVRKEQAFHFPYARSSPPAEQWPTFIYKGSSIQTYGLPGGRDAADRGQKVAEYNGGPIIPSARFNDGVIDPANRARVVAFVKKFLPALVPEPYAETTCVFTNTPTEDFVIDGADGLTIVSPCSGHGAKFAPLIGRLAADAATGDAPVPKRFTLPRP